MIDAADKDRDPAGNPTVPGTRFDDLVRHIPQGVCRLRADADGSVRFEYLNPQLCLMLGCDPAAVLADARLAYRAIHPDDIDGLSWATTEALRSGDPLGWEGRFVAGDDVRWIRLDADRTVLPGGDAVWNGVASDVTARRLAEDRLRDSEETYRQLNELAPNPIVVADLEGNIRIVNPRALQFMGLTRESQAIGRSIFEWAAPTSLAAARAKFAELFVASTFVNLELDFIRADGTTFSGEANASMVRDEHGRPRQVIIIVSDLTQRRQLEDERLRLQKMEAIGTLAGGLAHDFNNLLQGVFGYISLAQMKLDDPVAAGALLARAEGATGQAVSLTSQLLTFARGGEPQKKRLALRDVVESATRFALSGSATVFTLSTAADLRDIDADEGQIAQVIQNVVMNAREAMLQGGVVRIDLRNVDLPAQSDEALPRGGRFAAVRITDTGAGIPGPCLAKIFDPYFTTREEGSGLGLATSWSIVKRHGGTIRVETGVGSGSSFEVLLPAAEPAAEPRTAAAEPGPADLRKVRVLIMDDEDLVREVAVAMVESLGFAVGEAADGAEAVLMADRARAEGTPYDIVILDLTVRGGMGGDEAIGRIRALTPDLRAIVSSGYSASSVVADYRAHGFDAYLNKPYTLESLRTCLAALLAG
jgi:PAS domain S-box-containing protein